jgi:hypothetical protein
VSHFSWDGQGLPAAVSDLLALDAGGLSPVASLEGSYTFSVSQEGLVLGRMNRSWVNGAAAQLDGILDPRTGAWRWLDLGHYDALNHYLRVDHSPHLFFVQGTPPDSHQHKVLCTVSPGGQVQRLWPLLKDRGDAASHAMECCFCYVRDEHGEGMIVAGEHHNPDVDTPYQGFIYRRNLASRHESWRHATAASATSIQVIPGSGVVLAAFLDGQVAAFRAGDGHVLAWKEFRPDGLANVVMSLDTDGSQVLVGLLDGRYGLLSTQELLAG